MCIPLHSVWLTEATTKQGSEGGVGVGVGWGWGRGLGGYSNVVRLSENSHYIQFIIISSTDLIYLVMVEILNEYRNTQNITISELVKFLLTSDHHSITFNNNT